MKLPGWLTPYSLNVFENFKLIYFWMLGRKQKNLPRIFVIGQNKTGTTSVHKALRKSGSRHLTINTVTTKLYKNQEDEKLMKIAERFDTFDDWPWNRPRIVKKAIDWFPDARFVLIERDEQKWISSFRRFMIVSKREEQLPENVGMTDEEYIEKHLHHFNAQMKSFFEHCPERLLVINLEDLDASEKLSVFTMRPNLKVGWENKTPPIER
jgi:hypothetical protein